MNYELAKKLKEAGFPQRKETFAKIGGINFGSQVDDGTKEGLTIPTLEELIEACGDGITILENWGDGWSAYEEEQNLIGIETKGKTLSEAIANLWLKLNKK